MTDAARAHAAEVTAALRRFLDTFEQPAWDALRACFADDICVCFPSAATAERFTGRAAVEARFAAVYDTERRAAAPGPPYVPWPDAPAAS